MRGAYVVHAEVFHQLYAFLHGTRIGGSSESTECMVVGIAFEQHFLPVEEQSLARYQSHVAYSKPLCYLVAHCAVFAYEPDSGSIEVRILAVPQLRVSYFNCWQSKFLSEFVVSYSFQFVFAVAHHSTVWRCYCHLHGYGVLLCFALHVNSHVHIFVFPSGDIERMAVEV